jgi:hypothetical protein
MADFKAGGVAVTARISLEVPTLCNLDLDLATGDSARLSVQARHPECGLDSRSIGRGGKLHGQKK